MFRLLLSIHIPLFILISLLLTGCASSSLFFSQPTTQELIEEHQFKKAIKKIRSENPNNQQLLFKVKKLADQHVKNQTARIKQLLKKKQWGEARATLDNLYINQPILASYSDLLLDINKGQQEEERIINTKRALLEYDFIHLELAQEDLSNRIYYQKNNWFSKQNQLNSKKQRLAEKLLQLSTQALLVKDYKNAQDTYEKAIILNPKLHVDEITNTINIGLSKQNNRAINKRQKSLIRQLDRAIKKQDFKSLITIQTILSNDIFSGLEVQKALIRAGKTRNKNAQQLDTVASKEYRKGNISAAVSQWQKALKLAPRNNEIQEKLIRAKKVKNKLKKLSNDE